MSTGKTIQLYLPDGELEGLRVASFTRGGEKLFQIPRAKLAAAIGRSDLKRPGIYFLIAPHDFRSGAVYIGETENFAERISYHSQNKESKFDWQYAMVCVSSAFNKAHVRYLEWHCIAQAKAIGRYTVVNPKTPKRPHTDETMDADLVHDFEVIRTLSSTLGFPLFEPMHQVSSKGAFSCKGKKAMGNGSPTDNGFVVFQGSVAMSELAPSTDATVVRRHAELVGSKVLVSYGSGTLQFSRDYEFSSPSTAAAVVLGRSANGWTEWKDEKGRTLDELVRKI